MAQSTSSALPPLEMASFAVASRPASRVAGAATRSGTTARSFGWSRACVSMSLPPWVVRLSGSASASSCRDRRRRRRPRASVPPRGPQRSSAAVGSSSSAGRSAQRSSISKRAGAGLIGQRQLVPGQPRPGRWPRSARGAGAAPAGWPSGPGRPCPTTAPRRPGARGAACRPPARPPGSSCPRPDADLTGGLSGIGTSSRCRAWAADAPGAAGSRRATRRDAASSSRPLRRQVRSATTGAGWPSAVRNRSGNSVSARTSAPRNA